MKIKPQKHLINILVSTKNHHPNFTLFLGAGASITSGVKSAAGMIRDWRESYTEMHSDEELKSQNWYEKDNEYSELFESLYDQPTQRREYIESCITEANPSWGYVYLVNLLKERHFNTIFTTNFDDLVNEACYTFSDNLRPVVCAHDSSINSVRLTSSRPKIIKLHGDFLFDNIKNTIRELESLEDNMRSKFRQFANEFGMIVMGYSGHDRSIMDTLNTLLHSGSCFPHGIYWCTRDEFEDLPEALKNLARFPRFHLVRINGFDEFMAELHDALGCTLQDEVINPYSALSKKLDRYFSSLEETDGDELSNHYIINNDMINLADHVRRVNSVNQFVLKIKTKFKDDKELDHEAITKSLDLMLKETKFAGSKGDLHFYNTPNFLIANSAFRSGDYDECIEYSKKHLENGRSVDALILICRALIKKGSYDEMPEFFNKLVVHKNLTEIEVNRLISLMVDLINESKFDDALSIHDYILSLKNHESAKSILTINKSLITKLKGESISESDAEKLNYIILKEDKAWLAFGAAILLDSEDVVLELAKNLPNTEIQSVLMQDMPIFTLLSSSLYEKVKEIAVQKGFDVPLIDDEDDPSVDTADADVSEPEQQA